jgi:hypothetical protein
MLIGEPDRHSESSSQPFPSIAPREEQRGHHSHAGGTRQLWHEELAAQEMKTGREPNASRPV